MRLFLPWPPKILSPNARAGWRARSKAIRDSRFQARMLTQSQPYEPVVSVQGLLPISLIFHPPDKRHRDLDNCLSSSKSILDGIADGLGINDKRFRIAMQFGDPIQHGEVEVVIG